jgi:DNA-binding transcriptional MerR regulator
VDAHNGHRWYDPAQVEYARRVALLRRLDVPLARIPEPARDARALRALRAR